MRISDWSSDVCSSDLQLHGAALQGWRASRLLPRRRAGPHQVLRPRVRGADQGRAPAREDRRARQSPRRGDTGRSEEHTSELQSLMRISYAVFCLKKKNKKITTDAQPNSTDGLATHIT